MENNKKKTQKNNLVGHVVESLLNHNIDIFNYVKPKIINQIIHESMYMSRIKYFQSKAYELHYLFFYYFSEYYENIVRILRWNIKFNHLSTFLWLKLIYPWNY